MSRNIKMPKTSQALTSFQAVCLIVPFQLVNNKLRIPKDFSLYLYLTVIPAIVKTLKSALFDTMAIATGYLQNAAQF